MNRRAVLWVLLLLVLAGLSIGTISNTVKTNRANAQISAQAAAGQRGLTRQCRLFPIGKKLYAWGLRNGDESGITPEDFALVITTAEQACGQP